MSTAASTCSACPSPRSETGGASSAEPDCQSVMRCELRQIWPGSRYCDLTGRREGFKVVAIPTASREMTRTATPYRLVDELPEPRRAEE
jgi:hypothetical protein